MKNKIFLLVLSTMLLLPLNFAEVRAVADEDLAENTNIELTDIKRPLSTLDDKTEDILPVKNSYKTPNSKKKIVKKFALAMLGVGFSSFLIFFFLTLYNRIRGKILNEAKTLEGSTPLKTPNDINEAVKTFLDKTNW